METHCWDLLYNSPPSMILLAGSEGKTFVLQAQGIIWHPHWIVSPLDLTCEGLNLEPANLSTSMMETNVFTFAAQWHMLISGVTAGKVFVLMRCSSCRTWRMKDEGKAFHYQGGFWQPYWPVCALLFSNPLVIWNPTLVLDILTHLLEKVQNKVLLLKTALFLAPASKLQTTVHQFVPELLELLQCPRRWVPPISACQY